MFNIERLPADDDKIDTCVSQMRIIYIYLALSCLPSTYRNHISEFNMKKNCRRARYRITFDFLDLLTSVMMQSRVINR